MLKLLNKMPILWQVDHQQPLARWLQGCWVRFSFELSDFFNRSSTNFRSNPFFISCGLLFLLPTFFAFSYYFAPSLSLSLSPFTLTLTLPYMHLTLSLTLCYSHTHFNLRVNGFLGEGYVSCLNHNGCFIWPQK